MQSTYMRAVADTVLLTFAVAHRGRAPFVGRPSLWREYFFDCLGGAAFHAGFVLVRVKTRWVGKRAKVYGYIVLSLCLLVSAARAMRAAFRSSPSVVIVLAALLAALAALGVYVLVVLNTYFARRH